MKVVILAGGAGTRISEESYLKPKPMIDIGPKPIIWHIMKHYSAFGFNEFIICLGYKGYMIKEYFQNYYIHNADLTFDLTENSTTIHRNDSEPWRVTLIETGVNTMTGGRVKRARDYIGNERFHLTYGDGLSNVDIMALFKFHEEHGKLATVTAVQPKGRFGALDIDPEMKVHGFKEKPNGDGGWINGGFFIFEPEVLDYIENDETILERKPLQSLSMSNQLMAYCHPGFWQCMDTVRDKQVLEEYWAKGNPPWQTW